MLPLHFQVISKMFFVFIFLILATLGAYLFPAWSWAMVLAVSFACTAVFRLILVFTGRKTEASPKDDPS